MVRTDSVQQPVQCKARETRRTDVLGMPGVKDFITASALPTAGINCWMGDNTNVPGSDLDKEKIFFEVAIIPVVGAQLGVIVAETWAQAYEAARAVKQTYSSAALPVMNIADARRRGLKVPEAKVEMVWSSLTRAIMLRGVRTAKSTISNAPPRSVGASTTLSANAEIKTSAQTHFQLETRAHSRIRAFALSRIRGNPTVVPTGLPRRSV